MKSRSTLYTAQYLARVAANASAFDWAAKQRGDAIAAAQPWKNMSDDALWDLMFGNTITRHGMVWSTGNCPACGKPVKMYSWEIDVFGHPWKVRCPHCGEYYPKNDFAAYYRSGLDESNVFRYELADDRLLTVDGTPGNSNSPFGDGIDDGEGSSADNGIDRWHFIGFYLLYGQWEQLVVGGCFNLALAYLYTGDRVYAHKAAILLDRVADLFPTFDFRRQGYCYEKHSFAGYVGSCINSNIDVFRFAFAYDMIFDAVRDDAGLVDFLHEKSLKYKVARRKESFSDIQSNIEERIFEDAVQHSCEAVPKPRGLSKVWLNYPMEKLLILLIDIVTERDKDGSQTARLIREISAHSFRYDGTTGERGFINGYCGLAIIDSFQFIQLMVLSDGGWVKRSLEIGAEKTLRTVYDLWFCGRFFPNIGDGGTFGEGCEFMPGNFKGFRGMPLPGFDLFTLLWKYYKLTGDRFYLDFIREKTRFAPLTCDIGMEDAADLIGELKSPRRVQVRPCGSHRLDGWKIAAVRGEDYGGEGRSVWLHYESKAHNHDHSDIQNLGMYGFGVDLMPDNGYPPVQYDDGGFLSVHAQWYSQQPYMHNLVVVDRQDMHPLLPPDGADMDQWYAADGSKLDVWDVSGAVKRVSTHIEGYPGLGEYRRSVCFIDLDENSSVITDVVDVRGGCEHLFCLHAGFGEAELKDPGGENGKTLEFPKNVLLRGISGGRAGDGGYVIDWKLRDTACPDRPRDLRMRCFGLTQGCEIYRGEMWVSASVDKNGEPYTWLPMFMTRRYSEGGGLASRFVCVYVPSLGPCPVVRASYDGKAITLSRDGKPDIRLDI